ncbi:MAG: peptidylprolyl isomerase [Elusimicrobia bacterium]|nr:peptidylprolyl isomerase [Elusimicrobiota bacterium]
MRPYACLALLFVLAGAAYAKDKKKEKGTDVLATVNGAAIKREDVASRIWGLYANDALNQMVDETLIAQAAAAWEAKADSKDKDAVKSEVDARLQKLKAQFQDEAAFSANLQRSGVTLGSLRKQIESQVERERLVISAKGLSVTPAEAKEFFDANKDKLGSQEAVRLRHILVSAEQQAKDLLVAIRVGADFAKLAREISLDAGSKDRGGDLGFISRGMLQPDIEKVVFSLKPGEFSQAVKGPLGYHIFKAEETREARPAVYGDIERDLTQAILAQKVTQAWPIYLKELRDSAKIVPASEVAYTPAQPAPRSP